MRGLHLAREKMIRLCHMAFKGLSEDFFINLQSPRASKRDCFTNKVHKATQGVHEATKGCSHVNQRHLGALQVCKFPSKFKSLSHKRV